MIIRYEGGEYPFDMDDTDVQQALKIEEFMGCSFAEWGKKLMAGGDLKARMALGWLILHPAGDVAIGDVHFKMARLGEALDEAYAAEAAKQEKESGPVPTAAASTGRKRASTAASSPAS